ncbi:MAG: collagen binding domain-containing protein, partial [Acutalibacteraceae bacterium]
LFSFEALTDNNGKSVLPADSLIDVISIEKDGKGMSAVDLPLGKYYLKEIATAKGFNLLETKFNFEFSPSDSNEEVQTIDINSTCGNIVNKPLFGNVEIIKTDKVTGNKLPGAVYSIYSTDGKLIGELTTDENGYAKSELISYGEYYLKETTAPDGYVVDNNKYSFFIGANGKNEEIITIEVSDDPIVLKTPTPKKTPTDIITNIDTPKDNSPKTDDLPFDTVNNILLIISGTILGAYIIFFNKKRIKSIIVKLKRK